MERNDWGFDYDARIVSMNEMYELYDALNKIWEAKFEEVEKMEEFEPIKYARLHGTLDGIELSKKAVFALIHKANDRMTLK